MQKLIELLKKMPLWARIVFLLALSCALVVISFNSCSSVRAISYGDGRLSTTVHQSVADSTSVTINFSK